LHEQAAAMGPSAVHAVLTVGGPEPRTRVEALREVRQRFDGDLAEETEGGAHKADGDETGARFTRARGVVCGWHGGVRRG
jgi:hypothetical protein